MQIKNSNYCKFARTETHDVLRLAILICLIFVRPQSVYGNNSTNELPPEVRQQLESNAIAMRSVHLEYVETQSGEAVPDYYWKPTTYTVTFASNLFYFKMVSLNINSKNAGGAPDQFEAAFDGDFLYYGSLDREPWKGPDILVKYRPGDKTDPRLYVTIPFLYPEAAGFYSARCIGEFDTFSGIESLVLRSLASATNHAVHVEKKGGFIIVTTKIPDPLLLAARRRSAVKERNAFGGDEKWKNEKVEELQKVQEMVPQRTVKFTLDPNRGFAVVEREDFTDAGQMFVRVTTDFWKHYGDPGVWLPEKCVESYYLGRFAPVGVASAEPRLTATFNLKNVDFGAQRSVQFALNYTKRGTQIEDRTSPEAQAKADHSVSYTVAADGTALRHAAENIRIEMTRTRRIIWTSFLALVLLAPIVVSVARSFRRKHP